jgi:hypothetical protein
MSAATLKPQRSFCMKKKLNLLVMLVCLLALSLVFIGCPTDSDDSGGGGGKVPTELIGSWEKTSGEHIGRIYEFTETQWKIITTGQAHNVTVSGNTITKYNGDTSYVDGTVTYAIAGTTLTITAGTYTGSLVGTYTKQP